jgi:superfamily II DNA or RNA helicase
VEVKFNLASVDDYRTFLKVKALPRSRFVGRTAEFPDEYAGLLGVAPPDQTPSAYAPPSFLFDYQRDVAGLAIRKKRFAVFMRCGLGKTFVLTEFAKHAHRVLPRGRKVLIVSPLMVVRQTLAEAIRFYGKGFPVERSPAADLPAWLEGPSTLIGITNYEAITEKVRPGKLGALVLDESSLLKSHYGRWGQRLIKLGRGLEWKLCLTGTPAPNDRIEYGNHAVFLDQHPTVNAFLARYFVNRGQTDNRWELKPHALRPFYRSLSHWCVFVTDPATYGWRDNVGGIPPVNVHIHDVPLTPEQRDMVTKAGGDLFGTPGGITSRAKLGQLAKGRFGGKDVATNKNEFIRDLVAGWSKEESTLVWCLYNREQEAVVAALPGCASIAGDTPQGERERVIAAFQAGECRTLVSKGKVLGFGLNLQVATRQVFSGLQDSYELFHQCVSRSNRVGSTRDLNVHIPVTTIERPMVDTVLAKAKRVDRDEREQESIFKECFHGF